MTVEKRSIREWMAKARNRLVVVLLVTASSLTHASGAVALAVIPVDVTPHAHDPFSFNLQEHQTVDSVKSQVETYIGVAPENQCLLHEGVQMMDGHPIDDYGIVYVDANTRYALAEFDMPIVAGWSVTPEDGVVGDQIENFPVTWPQGNHFAVSAGSLPEGISLNADTGVVTGSFTEAGTFSVTIAIDTDCGPAEITWSGEVKPALANTGFDAGSLFSIFVAAVSLVALGAKLVINRRRRAN